MDGTGSVEGFLKTYFIIDQTAPSTVINNGSNPATFPNVFKTISEADIVNIEEVFQRILSNQMIDWVGFLAFLVLVLLRWQVLLPLAPMLALGLLSFKSSNRFIMYLAPFIGIGLGWILSLGIEGMFNFLPRNHAEATRKNGSDAKGAKKDAKFTHHSEKEFNGDSEVMRQKGFEVDWFGWVRQGTLYLGMGFFFWVISSQTAISFVPAPSIHPRIFETFLEVKKRVSDNSKLLTWWDYGHTLNDIGFGTFHDGGNQVQPKTYFIARGLISPDKKELYDITQFLATEGNGGIIKNNTSPEALLQAVRNPQKKPLHPIYLFFTADMTGKFGAISNIGSWDLVNGGSQPRVYQNLACNKITNEEMNCRGMKIDLKAGKINNQVALRRMVFIRDGQVLREQEFGHSQGYTLQLIVAGRQIVEVQLIDEAVFLSNYNQMFLLGRYRKDLFEETYNAFPFSRLYRIKY